MAMAHAASLVVMLAIRSVVRTNAVRSKDDVISAVAAPADDAKFKEVWARLTGDVELQTGDFSADEKLYQRAKSMWNSLPPARRVSASALADTEPVPMLKFLVTWFSVSSIYQRRVAEAIGVWTAAEESWGASARDPSMQSFVKMRVREMGADWMSKLRKGGKGFLASFGLEEENVEAEVSPAEALTPAAEDLPRNAPPEAAGMATPDAKTENVLAASSEPETETTTTTTDAKQPIKENMLAALKEARENVGADPDVQADVLRELRIAMEHMFQRLSQEERAALLGEDEDQARQTFEFLLNYVSARKVFDLVVARTIRKLVEIPSWRSALSTVPGVVERKVPANTAAALRAAFASCQPVEIVDDMQTHGLNRGMRVAAAELAERRRVRCGYGFEPATMWVTCGAYGKFEPTPECVVASSPCPAYLAERDELLLGTPLVDEANVGEFRRVACGVGYDAFYATVGCTTSGFKPTPTCIQSPNFVWPLMDVSVAASFHEDEFHSRCCCDAPRLSPLRKVGTDGRCKILATAASDKKAACADLDRPSWAASGWVHFGNAAPPHEGRCMVPIVEVARVFRPHTIDEIALMYADVTPEAEELEARGGRCCCSVVRDAGLGDLVLRCALFEPAEGRAEVKCKDQDKPAWMEGTFRHYKRIRWIGDYSGRCMMSVDDALSWKSTMPKPSLPPNWEEDWSTEHYHPYYRNVETGATSWTRPEPSTP